MHEYSSWLIRLTSAQHCPNNPGILVRQRHRGDVLVAPRDQALQPFTFTVGFVLAGIHHCPSTMNQQGSQIRVTAFSDPTEAFLPTARMLAWHQPHPCR